MILSWAEQSGIWKPRGFAGRACNDKPDMNFQVPEMDDNSIRKAIYAVAPMQARNFVIMEVKGNLMEDERKSLLAPFPASTFKRIATVMIGDPTAEFKKYSQQLLLKQKQEASDKTFVLQKLEEKRKKMMAKRQKELELAQKKALKEAEKERKRLEREAKKKAAEENQEGEKKEGDEEKKDDVEMVDESDKEEEEEKAPEEEEEEKDEKPPKVELTAEEKKQNFMNHELKDLIPPVLNDCFTKFTIPSKDDGFDDVKYEWTKGTKCQEYLKKWILDRKLSMPVESLQPSPWFSQQWAKFQTTTKFWHIKVSDYKAMVQRKAAEKATKEAMKKAKAERKAAIKQAKEEAKRQEEERKKAAEEAAKAAQEQKEAEDAAKKEAGAEEEKKDGEEAKNDAEGEKKEAEGEKKEEDAKAMDVEKEGDEEEKEEEEEEEKEEEEEVVDFEGLDIFGVEDIMNIGASMPLFKDFEFEDWVMLSLRYEMYVLATAFSKDVDDPDRKGIHLDHLAFYYSRYFKETLNPKDYGVETFKGIVDLIGDVVRVNADNILESKLGGELETMSVFAKLTEEARRHRSLRLALGEDEARLKLTGVAVQGQRSQHAPRRPGGYQGNRKGDPRNFGKASNKGGQVGGKGGPTFHPYNGGKGPVGGIKGGGGPRRVGFQQHPGGVVPVVGTAPLAARIVPPLAVAGMVHNAS